MMSTRKQELTQDQEQFDTEYNNEYVRLLLIDDNVQDNEALRETLSRYSDIEIFQCSDPSQALKAASDAHPTVILLAHVISGTSGLDLIKAFREQYELSSVPIVILYSKSDESDTRERVFSSGADDCMVKLCSEDEAVSRIRYHSKACANHLALREVTNNLEEMRKQIFDSEKMASIGQLAAGVAHEINNPIAFVTSNINSMEDYYKDVFGVISAYERLEDTLPVDAPEVKAVKELKERLQLDYIKEDIEQILNECKDGLSRVRKIVDDLKNFSREEEVEWQWADLHKELDSTLNIANHEIKYKADIDKNYGDLPDVECIPSQLNQVFLNLLVNAAHAINDRGTITLTTLVAGLPERLSGGSAGSDESNATDSWVCIEITDTGSGIDADTISQIFNPFFTTKPAGKGTGLGLSLSNNIVQKHRGYIDVDSEPGKGTTFSVWLPVCQNKNIKPE